jgi:glycosyltransferase involved in cell wall biosynthesis
MFQAFKNSKVDFKIPATQPDGSSWPKISIVTPSYNNAKYVEDTILSVFLQDYPNVEHIIVDGASKDGTAAILDRHRDKLAHVIQEADTGQSNAINKGMRLATGDIVTWLNSDDMLAPGALVAVAMAFHTSGADMVVGGCQLFRNGRFLGTHLTACTDGPLPADEISDLYGGWQTGKFFYQPEVMFTRDLWLRAGGHVREDLHFCMDVEMWLRFATFGAKLHVIGAPVAMFRLHEEQKTNNRDASPDEYLPIANSWRAKRGFKLITKSHLPDSPPPLRVAFVNDIGFLYGAGIAHKRLFKSLLAAGHVCKAWATGFQTSRGKFELRAAKLISELRGFAPDIVVCGNLHCTLADSDILERLTSLWPTCFCIHDLWLLTGHCPHPGFLECDRHLFGCDHACPSPDTYPAIDPANINSAWAGKRRIMGKNNFLALANSGWTREQYNRCSSEGHEARLLRLGCDEANFHPGSRQEARQSLGLDENAFIVFMPMVDFSSPFKGSIEGLEALSGAELKNLQILCFGVVENEILERYPLLKSLGYLHEPEFVATAYRASDVVVSFSHAETFGQTLMEAGCCGIPTLAYRCTGQTDAVFDGVTGFLVLEKPEALVDRLREFHCDAGLRNDLGAWSYIHSKNTRTLHSEYHSFHTAIQSTRLLPPGRVRKNIFFDVAADKGDVVVNVEKPSSLSVLKDRLRRNLPYKVWEVLRRVYRGITGRSGTLA